MSEAIDWSFALGDVLVVDPFPDPAIDLAKRVLAPRRRPLFPCFEPLYE
jgi:hypothetical protein